MVRHLDGVGEMDTTLPDAFTPTQTDPSAAAGALTASNEAAGGNIPKPLKVEGVWVSSRGCRRERSVR